MLPADEHRDSRGRSGSEQRIKVDGPAGRGRRRQGTTRDDRPGKARPHLTRDIITPSRWLRSDRQPQVTGTWEALPAGPPRLAHQEGLVWWWRVSAAAQHGPPARWP